MMNIHAAFDEAMKRQENVCSNAITHSVIKDCLLPRPKNIHKGDCGRLFVCAGSVGLTGAAVLAVRAALRSGAGLITLGCCEELNTIFEIKLTEAMTLPLQSQNGKLLYSCASEVLQRANASNALLLGPGLSVSEDLRRLVYYLVRNCEVPLILDADALNMIAEQPEVLKSAQHPVIITPHIGEFSRLTRLNTDTILADTEYAASEFCEKYKCITILKSHRTVVAAPGKKPFVNILGNPGMATGGSGDVLAGITASFVSQKKDAYLSALAATYLHSLAADMASYDIGEYSLLPGDIINYLPYAIKKTQEKNQSFQEGK